ncbi:MAG: hypothetical protein N2049_09430 [Anaerolineales bacterium]|nr:hypothetical protein [Anaerolineales bacterium]
MTLRLDLNLSPIYRVKGRDLPSLPGLAVASPPKRCGRGREDDQLLLYLSLSGNTPLTVAEYNRLTGLLVEQYYRTAGTVTSALRAAAERLNQTLLESNLRNRGKGQHLIGRLVLGTLRGTQLLLCQCGPTHVFHFTQSGQAHYHDESPSNRALGVSQVTPLYFSHLTLNPGDVLLVLAALPSGWEAERLAGLRKAERLQQSLISLSAETISAVIIEATTGKGQVRLLPGVLPARPEASTESPEESIASDEEVISTAPTGEIPATPRAPSPPLRRPTSQVISGRPASRFARILAGEEEKSDAQTSHASSAPPLPKTSPPVSQPAPSRRSLFPASSPILLQPSPEGRQRFFRSLAKSLRQLRVGLHTTGERVRTFFPRLLPDPHPEEPKTTGSSLAFVAFAIPLLIMTIALVFYNQHGRNVSYQEYFQQALQEAQWAAVQTAPAEIRVGWERTLFYLDIAEQYLKTNESAQLRAQAQTALDNLDGILRLSFAPAIVNGLDRAINVSALAATNNDLYLLDATQGEVLRYYLTSQGYQADTAFVCRPGTYGDVTVGPLVDILAAPKVNPYNATLMALDGEGTLLYCFPSPRQPKAVKLARPELGWERLTGFTLDATTNYLYVIDPSRNAVWYYIPNEEGKYVNMPRSFFEKQVPANMSSVIDFAANGSDMYFLFQDGHLASCTLIVFQNVPKRCHDPLIFVDNRPERQPSNRMVEAIFTQMTFAEAPDQSLYLFDPYAPAVYRFSPRSDSLILLNQFRPAIEQSALISEFGATAMTINVNRTMFISAGRQVFYATDVP